MPHEQAIDAKDEVAFFQAIKARLVKFESSKSGKSDEEIDQLGREGITCEGDT